MALRYFKPWNLKFPNLLNKNTFCNLHACSNEQYEFEQKPHEPVMVNEVVELLNLKPESLFLDMTFGAGGHSLALLERVPGLRILALDRDPVAHKYIDQLMDKYPNQIVPFLGKFSELYKLLSEKGIQRNTIDGALFDVGCSSMQLDNGERGFSFNKNGPLDMRMSCGREPNSLTAADVLAYATEADLYSIFKVYGEEKRSRKIARAIAEARLSFKPLKTTEELTALVHTVCEDRRYDKLSRKANTATKVFQALRIFVNNELNELNIGLSLIHKFLKCGGRAVTLTFHSLEDTIVKTHFKNHITNNQTGPMPARYIDKFRLYSEEEISEYKQTLWNVVNKKVIVPSPKEVSENPRSRSAKLRAAIKVEPNSEQSVD